MILSFLFFVLVCLFVGAVVSSAVSRRYTTTRPTLTEAEKLVRRRAMFPRLGEGGRVVSIVIPCYNEEERLAPMIVDTIKFFTKEGKRALDVRKELEEKKREDGTLPVAEGSPLSSFAKRTSEDAAFFDETSDLIDAFEIIVVDDCSKDRTVSVAKEAFSDAMQRAKEKGRDLQVAEGSTVQNFTVVESKPNKGKGYAVRRGFFEAIGDYVLMADGDNATEISDASKLLKAIVSSSRVPFDMAVGSRAHLEHESIAKRTLPRTILMIAFHLVVKFTYAVATLGSICVIRDTQCGFKMFAREACEPLFLSNRLERWAFDVELLIAARRLGLRPVEVCVNWAEVPGSKVRLSGMVQMGLECLLMCFAYPLGFWEMIRSVGQSPGKESGKLVESSKLK